MEGAALAGAGQRDRPRKGGKRTKASKAQELFEEEVKRLVKLIDVKLTLQGLRNVVEYEEARLCCSCAVGRGTGAAGSAFAEFVLWERFHAGAWVQL